MRFYPPYAAKPYTEIVGKDQYLRLLFMVGYKPMAISELRLGETLLSGYNDVEWQILCGGDDDKDQDGNAVTAVTLFPASVDEVQPNEKLLGPGDPVEITTSLNTDEVSIDLTYPNGLIRIDHSGDVKTVGVVVWIEVKLETESAGSYVHVGTINASAQSPETIRRGYRYKFPSRDQYTVRISRTTDDIDINGNDQTYQDDCYLTAFRSITNENPVDYDNAALIAIRIKATDQLNGIVSNLNLIASSIFPDYDSATDTWIARETANPASLARAVLEGPANARPLNPYAAVSWLDGTPVGTLEGGDELQEVTTNDRIDLDDLAEWHTECKTASRSFNQIRDFESTVWDTLSDVCAAGRAHQRHVNGFWFFIRDKEQTEPQQHFTPRNSWGFSGRKVYLHQPHAFRVPFKNEDEGWLDDERIVYDDGYDETNATQFETLTVTGITNSDQCWSMGRYHIAAARLRPEIFTFKADVENIAVTEGDRIQLAHDVILVGLGSARITAITDNGSTVSAITVDDQMPMSDTGIYAVRIRHADGTTHVHAVQRVVGYSTTLTFTIPFDIVEIPSIGDLVMFGPSTLESMPLIITGIVPSADLSATVTALQYDDGIYTADTGTIPDFNSYVTQPPGAVVPVIEKAISDESVIVRHQDGTLQIRLMLSFGFLNNRAEVESIEVQYRPSNMPDWLTIPILPGDTLTASIYDVTEGVVYQVRARYRFLNRSVGIWSTVLNHQVVGKTSPPPDVQSFRVLRQPDGTREFSWSFPQPPPDLAGFRIKWRTGTSGADWATNMTDMLDGPTTRHSPADGLVVSSPWETNALSAGDYELAIKAVDTGGRESTNATYIISSLGDPRIANALVQFDEYRQGFKGTKTDCYWDETTGYLLPDGTDTWADLPTTWTAWTDWNMNPVASMVYETDPYDISAIVPFEPIVSVTVDSGTVTIEEAHSDDDITYSSWATLSGIVTARYIKFRVTLTTPTTTGIKAMSWILSADTVEEDINDLDTSTVSTSAGVFRLPITKSYYIITQVQLALQGVPANSSWSLEDKNSTSGPLINLYIGGTLDDNVIDAHIVGI